MLTAALAESWESSLCPESLIVAVASMATAPQILFRKIDNVRLR
jgi:hypothetical protein